MLGGYALAYLEFGAAMPDAGDLFSRARTRIFPDELDRVVRWPNGVVAIEVKARDERATSNLALASYVRNVAYDQVSRIDVNVVALVSEPPKVIVKID
jgi:hypothetical protein